MFVTDSGVLVRLPKNDVREWNESQNYKAEYGGESQIVARLT